MNKLKRWVPEYARLPFLVLIVWHLSSYSVAKYLTAGFYHYRMDTALDARIPFLPWTVVIYVLSYLFWLVNAVLIIRRGKAHAFRFFAADILCKVIVFITFLLVPTTIDRPEVTGSGFFNWAMRLIYSADTPDALFPSVHCLSSWLCWLGLHRQKQVPVWYRAFVFVFALLIFISTLTTKQHMLVDVPAGCIVASFGWWAACHSRLPQWYERLYTRGKTQ